MGASSRPILIAHRGESHDAPENTLAAVNLAWQRGVPAVEVDVRMTADGALVVIHDADTRRIGRPRRLIRTMTLAAVRTLDAGTWKDPRWAGERIPRLRDVLATVPGHGRLFIEMKEGAETVPALLADIGAVALDPGQVVVMSFLSETVHAVARALPGIEVCLLVRVRDYLPSGAWERVLLQARELGATGLDVESHPRLNAARIEAAHSARMPVYVWTVNRPATARRLAAAGIDGITTDRAAWLREQLGWPVGHQPT